MSINIVATASTNLLPPAYLETHTMSPAEISHRIYGSKMTLVVEQCQCATTWLVKACLLIMYHRITTGAFHKQNFFVKILAAYVGGTFVIMEILYFGVWCRPFHNYWAVPTPNPQCSAALHHLITNAVFNLSSDLAMLCISLPMFVRSHLPIQRKITLCAIFSLGIFVILSAVLNKYYSFTDPYGIMWTYWYVRECSTALLVANLPFLWGLVRKCLGLNEDDGRRSVLSWRKRKDILPTLRGKLGVIPGLHVSTPAGIGTSQDRGTQKTEHSGHQSSETSGTGSSAVLFQDATRNSYPLQPWGPRAISPSKLEAAEYIQRRPSSRPSSRASSRASGNLPSSVQLPTSRLEAELMKDEGLPSPRLPFHLRGNEGLIPTIEACSSS